MSQALLQVVPTLLQSATCALAGCTRSRFSCSGGGTAQRTQQLAVVPVADKQNMLSPVVPEATRLACSRCSRARLLSVIHTSHVRGRDVKVKPVCPLLHSASLRHRRDRRRYQAFCQGLTPRSTKEPRWAYGEGPRGPRRRACARAGIHIHQSMPYGLRSFNRLSFVGGRSAGGARARARQTPYIQGQAPRLRLHAAKLLSQLLGQ